LQEARSLPRSSGCCDDSKAFRRIFSRFEKRDVMFTAFMNFAHLADVLRIV